VAQLWDTVDKSLLQQIKLNVEQDNGQSQPQPSGAIDQSNFRSQYEPAPTEDVNQSTIDDSSTLQE